MVLVWSVLLLAAVVPVGTLYVLQFGLASLVYMAPVLAICAGVGVLGLGYYVSEPWDLVRRALGDLEYAAAIVVPAA